MLAQLYKGQNYYDYQMYLKLPHRILGIKKVDFGAIRIVLEDKPDVKFAELQPIKPKDYPRLGLTPRGYLEPMGKIIPLDACIQRALAEYQSSYPLALKGDWYLTTSGHWRGSTVTNGTHALEETSKGLLLTKLGSTPRAVKLDPVGMSRDSRGIVGIVFPLERMIKLIEEHETKLADPYAWTKQFVPNPHDKGSYVEVLVLGGKE